MDVVFVVGLVIVVVGLWVRADNAYWKAFEEARDKEAKAHRRWLEQREGD